MHLFIDIVAVILGIVGLIGCFLPVLPGPPVSWGALLLLYFWGDGTMSLRFLLIWLGITIVVTVLDYIVPAYFTKITGGSKAAARFSMAGMIIGILFFPPIGMIIGAFVGALLGEWYYSRENGSFTKSLKPAFGSFLGFLFGIGLKLAASGIMMYYIVIYL